MRKVSIYNIVIIHFDIVRVNIWSIHVCHVSKCHFHADSSAVGICERCRRAFCVLDRRIYRKRRSSGAGEHRHTWTETYEYCLLCYTDAKISEQVGVGAYTGKIFIILFGIGWIMMTQYMGSFMPALSYMGIIGVLIIAFSVILFITGPMKANRFKEQREHFLQSLNYNEGITRISSKSRGYAGDSLQIHCMQCGEPIDLKDKFCKNCGDTTKDEKEVIEQQYQ